MTRGVFTEPSKDNPNSTRTPKIGTEWHTIKEDIARLYILVPNSVRGRIKTRGGFWDNVQAIMDQLCSPEHGYIDFILASADERQEEKVQVSETLGGNYTAFFFGEKSPIYSYTGYLLDTYQDEWYVAFSLMYDNILRGTMCAKLGVTVWLMYPGSAVNGVLLNFARTRRSDMMDSWGFNFSMLVRKHLHYYGDGAWIPDRPDSWGDANIISIDRLREDNKAVPTQKVKKQVRTATDKKSKGAKTVTEDPTAPYARELKKASWFTAP